MSEGVTQSLGQATAAKNDMGTAVDHIRKTISDIEASVDAVKAGWKGTANAAFNTSALEWHKEAERLKVVLNELTEKVGHGTGTFQAMNQENEDLLKI